MNTSQERDSFQDAFIKNFICVALGIIINHINGVFVYTFCKNAVFYGNSRYILYIHLVINDMVMLSITVGLHVVSYAVPFVRMSLCCFLLLLSNVTVKNTPLNLAGMAIERYIAVCKPLHHPQICTVKRTYILICLIWMASTIPALVDIFIIIAIKPLSFFNSNTSCMLWNVFTTQQHRDRATVVEIIFMLFVWLTLFYTYFMILHTAKNASTDQASAKKAQNTILLHGAQLLFSMLSYIAPFIDMYLVPLFPKSRSNILFTTFLLTHILPRLLSPLIYGIRDQQFVKYIKRYFSCSSNKRLDIEWAEGATTAGFEPDHPEPRGDSTPMPFWWWHSPSPP
ncbi:odorant receptor 131-2-like [Chanos chanos]|uniref:Odorant receptor 131-2-like n=1 Tax=Chanos chanos TaxID=29144 RepID=A0A6J2VSN8_CHACN|nr:odorant receptor 131-2-like [Chanos chanos]